MSNVLATREVQLWYCTGCGVVSIKDPSAKERTNGRMECSGVCEGKPIHKPIAMEFYTRQFVTT